MRSTNVHTKIRASHGRESSHNEHCTEIAEKSTTSLHLLLETIKWLRVNGAIKMCMCANVSPYPLPPFIHNDLIATMTDISFVVS